MSKLQASQRELANSFRGFRDHIKDAKNSRYICLDLFYAVECGLKAVIIKEQKKSHTGQLHENLLTHSLHILAKSCAPPITHTLPEIVKLCSDDNVQSISFGKLHQALRYGIKMPKAEWEKCTEALESLYEVIKQRLAR